MTKNVKKNVIQKKGARGRPATGHDPLMAFRVPPEIRERIEGFAREKEISLSKAIVEVLEKHLPKKGLKQ